MSGSTQRLVLNLNNRMRTHGLQGLCSKHGGHVDPVFVSESDRTWSPGGEVFISNADV